MLFSNIRFKPIDLLISAILVPVSGSDLLCTVLRWSHYWYTASYQLSSLIMMNWPVNIDVLIGLVLLISLYHVDRMFTDDDFLPYQFLSCQRTCGERVADSPLQHPQEWRLPKVSDLCQEYLIPEEYDFFHSESCSSALPRCSLTNSLLNR